MLYRPYILYVSLFSSILRKPEFEQMLRQKEAAVKLVTSCATQLHTWPEFGQECIRTCAAIYVLQLRHNLARALYVRPGGAEAKFLNTLRLNHKAAIALTAGLASAIAKVGRTTPALLPSCGSLCSPPGRHSKF